MEGMVASATSRKPNLAKALGVRNIVFLFMMSTPVKWPLKPPGVK